MDARVAPPSPDLSLATSHLHPVHTRRRRAGCSSHRNRRLGEGRPMVGDLRQGGISEAAGWRDSGSMDPTLRAHVGQILTVASRGFLQASGGKTSPIV
ncbi:hypothetical protein ACQJBY_058658 [Aegilops geniculata]